MSSDDAWMRLIAEAIGGEVEVATRRPRMVPSGASIVYRLDDIQAGQRDPQVMRSDQPIPDWLWAANPGNWQGVEWQELLGGVLGPWVMLAPERVVACICHTPRPMTARLAEAGVWTRPDVRGRGFATEATRAWTRLLRPSGRSLLYSTTIDNVASRRVAVKLGAREVGWCWGEGLRMGPVHPLSSLHTR